MTAPENRPEREALAEEAVTRVVRLHTGRATDPDRREIREWLASDPAHRAAFAEAEALWGMLGRIPDPRAEGAAGRRRARRMLAAAALAACVLAAGWIGLDAAGGMDRLRADYRTAVGATRTVILEDGSVVELNTGTALAVDMAGETRRVTLLHGEAYFSVSPDPDRPFDVIAGAAAARAVGTAFDVRADRGGVTVAVTEGHVHLAPRGRIADAAAGIELAPGETGRFAAGGARAVARPDADAATAWRRGRLVFVDRPLREVVADLDRYRTGTTLFLDGGLAERRFTGVFGIAERAEAMAVIEATLHVDAIHVTPWLTLLRRRD